MDLWKYFTAGGAIVSLQIWSHRFLEKFGLRKLKMKTFRPVVGQTGFGRPAGGLPVV